MFFFIPLVTFNISAGLTDVWYLFVRLISSIILSGCRIDRRNLLWISNLRSSFLQSLQFCIVYSSLRKFLSDRTPTRSISSISISVCSVFLLFRLSFDLRKTAALARVVSFFASYHLAFINRMHFFTDLSSFTVFDTGGAKKSSSTLCNFSRSPDWIIFFLLFDITFKGKVWLLFRVLSMDIPDSVVF